MTINHVHLAAVNLDETQRFYESLFGFNVDQRHWQGVFLKDPEGFLIAIDPVETRAEFPTWFHLGFCKDTESEVHATYSKAKEQGVAIARDMLTEPGKYASFYVFDPDGVRIEVSWHAE